MKKVLANNSEVAHVWAQQNQSEGRGSNMFFDGPSIYSYGRHFEIARFITPEIVFFNSRSYSNSTSKHQSYTRSAVDHKTVFRVPSMFDHGQNVEYFLKEMTDYLGQAKRARKNAEYFLGTAKEYLANAEKYVKLFGKDVPKQFKDQVTSLSKSKDLFNNPIIQKTLKENGDRRKAQLAETRKREEEKRLELQADYDAWKRGEDIHTTFYNMPVALRVKDETIQTTKGANVPLIEARKLWHTLVDKKPIEGMRVGHYTVTCIRENNLIVGCHTIPLREVVRMAGFLGWNDTLTMEVA